MMKKLNDFIFRYLVNNAVKIFGVALLFIICLQIYGRSFMASPPSWTEEMSRFTFVWYCFLSTAVTLRNKSHLGLDYFYYKFPSKMKVTVDWCIQLFTLFFGLFILYYGIPLLDVVGNRKAAITGWNMRYFYVVMPICGALLALVALEELEALFRRTFRKEEGGDGL